MSSQTDVEGPISKVKEGREPDEGEKRVKAGLLLVKTDLQT